MTPFVERAVERAGLSGLLALRTRGDLDAVRELVTGSVDLLILGALADEVRQTECGNVVRVHPAPSPDVEWLEREGRSELDLFRAIAIARITSARGKGVGVDWGTQGLEVPQVALGFGLTDLTGPITLKSGDLIASDDLKKVKGKGMVAKASLKRLEIAALIQNAGRICQFTDEAAPLIATRKIEESVHA